MKKIITCLSALFLLGACTSTSKHAAISNHQLNLYHLVGNKSVVARGAEGSSRRIFIVSTIENDMPSLSEAVTNALSKHNGDYIANAKVTHTRFHIIGLYHYSKWKVKGDVVRIFH